MSKNLEPSSQTLFERVGGEAFFIDLVDEFYRGVAADAVLGPMYPEYPDFSGARRRLAQFLVQYWGGPTTYSEQRGHPRLRMRHQPYHIGPLERDRWLTHMTGAVDTLFAAGRMGQAERVELLQYFIPTAEHLRNDTGLPISSAGFRVWIDNEKNS